MIVTVQIKSLSPLAYTPRYEHANNAGAQLRCIENKSLLPNTPVLVKTGLCINVPAGYEAQVRTSKKIVREHGLVVLDSPSTINAGEREEIKVLLVNASKKDFDLHVGDLIADLVISTVCAARFHKVKLLGS